MNRIDAYRPACHGTKLSCFAGTGHITSSAVHPFVTQLWVLPLDPEFKVNFLAIAP